MNLQTITSSLIVAILSPAALAGGNAAPSSHMVYDDANFEGDILINEVRVPKDGEAMYTYYEALGWSGKGGGYAGIQAHPKAHNYIFSIWDHKEHTAPIKALYQGPGTEVENFGGEGTGLKSWNFELGWNTGVWYTLAARCWPVDDHTHYGYWVRSEETEKWTHMVTMDVAAKEAYFHGGNDSFIEDWLETGAKARATNLRNGWKRKPDGSWHAFGRARYSVNSWDLTEGKRSYNFRENWDGGVDRDSTGEFYYMVSGGKRTTPSTTNPSSHTIKRTEERPGYAPIKIMSAKSTLASAGKLVVNWEIDPGTAPQFDFSIMAHSADGTEPLASLSRIEPHARSAELEIPKGIELDGLRIAIRCRDIFDNMSAFVPVD